MQLKIPVSNILARNEAASTKIVVNQGGTSSGKTYSILQLLVGYAYKEKLHISICSVNLPHLKKGAMRDFIEILTNLGIYDEQLHNMTDHTFKVGLSTIEFFALDNPGKARGPRRDILFVNECNLIPYETFNQLLLRTRKKVFIDYNPADEYHWIYDKILTRDDVTFIKSTYKDNPFLQQSIVDEIERLNDIDENLWKIYGLGERGQLKGLIYNAWDKISDSIFNETGMDVFYGLDFGFNVPTALVKIGTKDGWNYLHEELYQTGMTNSDLISWMHIHIPDKRLPIYADAAEPQRIQEIYRAGFNIKAANKSVKDGIYFVKSQRVLVTDTSTNIFKERQSYKWEEDKEGRTLDIPVKFNDHIMDAIRYGLFTHGSRPSGRYSIA